MDNRTNRPHIVLITADELRKDALSCYGNEAVQTPNLDKLARKSLTFNRAYAPSPWCMPSRCAILTGQLPHNNGAYSNFRPYKLSTEIPNLFTLLRQGGYRTTLFGKCHFAPVPYGEPKRDRTLPYDHFKAYYMNLGVDHMELQDDKQVSVWFYDDYAKELDQAGYLKAYRDAIWDVKGNGKVFAFPGPEEWHPDSWVGAKAERYISKYSEDRPLFSWISFSGPHYPFDPPENYLARVDMSKDQPRVLSESDWDDERKIHYRSYHGPGGIDGSGSAPGYAMKNHSDPYWFKLRQHYYANVAQIDEYAGKILETIERKFGDNVLIIFTADHGEMLGNHGVWGKNNCGYEDVLNVPLLVKYPGVNRPVVTDAKVMLTDIMATCLKAADLPPVQTNGKNFADVISEGGYPYVFSEGEGFVMVSDGRMKYVHVNKMEHGQGHREHYELYDLENDPHEFHDVIDKPEYAEIAAELRKQVVNLFLKKVLA